MARAATAPTERQDGESLSAYQTRMHDQGWRLNNLYKVVNKEGKLVPFRMNWAQQELWANLWFRNLIVKARQLGCTTFIDLFGLDCALFYPNFVVGIIAHKLPLAKEILRSKVMTPYQNLPEVLYHRFKAQEISGSKQQLAWTNGSSITVDTSFRSGTPSMIHWSEAGKMAAQWPERAREVITGAIEGVPIDGYVFIESTAEGRDGYFYGAAKTAKDLADAGRQETRLENRLFFFPWWREPTYRLSDEETALVTITDEEEAYFRNLEAEIGVTIDDNQRAWYVTKDKTLKQEMVETLGQEGGDIKREHPATFEEAFEASVQGAYFASQIALVRKKEQITSVPHDPRFPVDVFFDIGVDDYTAKWFYQQQGPQRSFIRYYENQDEDIGHYIDYLLGLTTRERYQYGNLYLPHDAKNRIWGVRNAGDAVTTLENHGFRVIVVESPPGSLGAQIQAARNVIPTCYFDAKHCAKGIKRLEGFRKKWDKVVGAYREDYLHDVNSHGATAFLKYAIGYQGPLVRGRRGERRRRGRNWRTA